MSMRRLFSLLMTIALLLSACATATPTATVAPTAAAAPTVAPTTPATALPAATAAATATAAPSSSPTRDNSLPFTHTACAAGVDLSGQTISFYHLLAQDESVDTYVTPLLAGYADATAYFNAHGGLCGATIKQVFPGPAKPYDPGSAYAGLLTQTPKPSLVILYSTSDAESLRDRLAKDQVAAVGFRVGSDVALYGYDGQTPGWIYSTNPRYGDQIGSMCDYIAAHPERFPHPVIGFVGIADLPSISATFGPGHQYCTRLGIGDGGIATVSGNDTQSVQPALNRLIQAGANIIFTFAYDEAPSSMAHDLVHMGVQTTVTLAAYSWAFDPASAWPGALDTGADGLPLINGMLGTMPARSLAETDQAGIQLINAQADASQTTRNLRTNGYVKAWSTTDLLRELYVQTGNRVGYDHITGAEIKATLDKLVYATLGGVEQIDFQGGALRTLTANRIGQLGYLGADGKTLAGPSNPPKNVSTTAGVTVFAPMVVPLTDYQPAPDLRPGGPNVAATPAPTAAPAATSAPATSTVTATGRIAFAQNTAGDGDNFQEIWVMNADGSDKTRLTNNDYYDGEPGFSPDGQKIVYASGRDGNTTIFVMNADGSGATNLTHSTATEDTPSWSPDGKKILFNSNRDGNQEIYVMNADGSGQTRLTNDPGLDEFPSWSPDGKKIAFDSDRGGNADVYVMNTDGSGLVDLTNNPAQDGGAVWSPDGKQIAFSSDRDGNFEVYVMNADGSHPLNLTHNPASDGKLSWSPDGKHITFDTDRDGTAQVYVMNADGSGQTPLTNDARGGFWPSWGVAASTPAATGQIAYYAGADHSPDNQLEIYLINPDGSGKIQVTNNQFSDDFPALSPDGKRVAFVSNRDGSDEIYVMPAPATQAEAAAADKSAVRLTKNGAQDENTSWGLSPQWSPDGKQIAFVSNHEGNAEIYVINADGTGQKRLTNNPATDTSPSWSPDGKHIAFDSDRSGNVDVYVMNVDGSGVKDLTNNPASDGQPAWSPDGQQIAFVSDRAGNGGQVFVMQADGSRQTNLSNSSGFAVNWSPDGADLAFFGDGDNGGLYIMHADGSNQTLLTNDGIAPIPTSWGR